ncbi:unnamed protein product, partial [marine sediment metagenome]
SDASTRGEFGMLTIYAKKDQERIDGDIFKIHPFLSFWGEGDCADSIHCPEPRRLTDNPQLRIQFDSLAVRQAESILREANHGS